MSSDIVWSLGLNCYAHNSSASLLRNGEIFFSCEEERFDRKKHSQAYPYQSIFEGLKYCGIQGSDISHVSYYFSPFMEISQNALHFAKYFPQSLQLLTSKGGSQLGLFERLKKQLSLPKDLHKDFGISDKSFHYIEHHLAHAASVFFPSPYSESAILTWDGRGESTTTLFAKGEGCHIQKVHEVKVPSSLGHLYSAVTAHLGFTPFTDEWKVMGMSAYGTDRYLKSFESLVKVTDDGNYFLDLDYFSFHYKGASQWTNEKFSQVFGEARKHVDEVQQKHFDLAYALQKTVEKVGVKLAQYLEKKVPSKNLCMTGGVSLNVLLNRRIMEETSFENFFIQPVATDAGTSFGAALYHYHQILGKTDRHEFKSPYLGKSFSDDEIEKCLQQQGLSYSRPDNISKAAAEEVVANKIVGWFQGRQESGPRALGNRSILANPQNPKMKDILNARVKRREYFRPFAPSVIEEKFLDYFVMPKNQKSPYMILAGHVKESYKDKLPAITHADSTARVHTVSKEVNLKYWELINHVGDISGIAVVLNTSFNENEPIVTSPQEAIDCFLRTAFDVLAIGPFLVKK